MRHTNFRYFQRLQKNAEFVIVVYIDVPYYPHIINEVSFFFPEGFHMKITLKTLNLFSCLTNCMQ